MYILSGKYQPSRGFTLTEILVAVSILAIVAIIVAALFSNVQNEAQNSTRKADIIAVAKALESKYDAVTGRYDATEVLSGAAFASGQVPVPPEGGSYFADLEGDIGVIPRKGTAFKVCAVLSDNSIFCKHSEQSTYEEEPSQEPYLMGNPPGGPTPTPTVTEAPTPTPTTAPTPTPTTEPTPTPTTAPTPTPTLTPTPTVTPLSCNISGPSTVTAGLIYTYSESTLNPVITEWSWTVTQGSISGSGISQSMDWIAPVTPGIYPGSTIHLDVDDGPGGALPAGCDFPSSITVDPAPTATPASTPTPTPTPAVSKRVFLYTPAITGNLGGLAGADSKCQTAAAGLGGTWKAWISDGTTSAASRLTQSTLPYKLLTGTTIANNWTDLVDGTILSPINIDQNGGTVTSGFAWTNTTNAGAVAGTSHCTSWTSGAGNKSGVYGNSSATGSTWTNNSLWACNNAAYLYCFEQ